MHTITCYNLGCADCTKIDLSDGRKLIVDYAATKTDDDEDKRADLPKLLTDDLRKCERDSYDVVAFTHLDEDHIKGSSDFFWMEHAKKYQDKKRVKIDELWVPAAVITEDIDSDGDAKVIQDEARHRLLNGKHIRVFSRPQRLEKWLKKNGLQLKDRENLITDAGKLVPGFTKGDSDGVEFFIHSPHAKRLDDGGIEDRNGDCLVFQARFCSGGTDTDVMFTGDAKYQTWVDVVNITRNKNRGERLHWNVYHLPHHCSYTAIGPEKSTRKSPDKTPPVEEVEWLCETQSSNRCIIISPSNPIPTKGSNEDNDVLPPHREAANYYKEDVINPKDGKFLVTMEQPSVSKPQPIVIQIGARGAIIETAGAAGSSSITGGASPRAGNH